MDYIKKYKNIVDIVKERLTCSAHNLDHVFRVTNLCLLIAESEKDVDLDILIPAALLHDIARVEESKDQTGKIDHAVLGSEIAGYILEKLGYKQVNIQKIKDCILAHRFRTGHVPDTIEEKILFDADKLDVIGASGIARTFMLAGQFGQSLSADDESIDEYLQNNTVENGRLKDVSKHSPFIEYELKFKKVPDKLYTKKAKEIGKERLAFMEHYFKRLKEEIKGLK